MRGSLQYYDSSAGSVFHRASKRELLLFLLSGFLFLLGCYRMSVAGTPEVSENISDFMLGAGIACFGFVLSWYNGKRWAGLMLAVAVVARLVLLPIPASEDLLRRMWEGEVLDADYNPYLLTPNAEELAPLQDANWERISRKDQTSLQTPMSLAAFRLFSAMGFNAWALKAIFVVFDLWICVMLTLRYGPKKGALYAWNPLVVYSIAGGGHMESMMLLPALGGFLIWDAWVDRKGGAVVINANGGLSGGLGQMVSFAALLIGLAAALNLVFLPIVVWMSWHILSKSGFKSGMAILLVGLIPLLAFSGWGAISLKVDWSSVLPFRPGTNDYSLSLLPATIEKLGFSVGADYFYWAVLLVSIILMFRNETMERFSNLYIGTYLVLGVAVFPWHFLWLAPFALGVKHVGFRLVSMTAFLYFLAYQATEGDVGLESWQSAVLWVPFLIGVISYALTGRSREDGLYVRSY